MKYIADIQIFLADLHTFLKELVDIVLHKDQAFSGLGDRFTIPILFPLDYVLILMIEMLVTLRTYRQLALVH